MTFLGKFPYLPKCCICISLRSGCVLVGLFSLLFHLVLFFFRDMVVAYYMKEALNRADTSAYAILSLLLIQTIFTRIPGIVASIAVVFGAFMRSMFIINICVWTYFYVIVLMVIGVLLAIGRLFHPRSEVFIAIILFDLLMFVFLNYFFLILNSYYHYLIQILNAQREACYATLRQNIAPIPPTTPPEERIYDTLDSN